MKEFTTVRSHTAAQGVTGHSETQAILRHMKESILNEKSGRAGVSVEFNKHIIYTLILGHRGHEQSA